MNDVQKHLVLCDTKQHRFMEVIQPERQIYQFFSTLVIPWRLVWPSDAVTQGINNYCIHLVPGNSSGLVLEG